MNNSGGVSTLLSQELGGALYYVQLVADNIQLLQDLAAQLNQKAEVVSLVRGSTSIVSHGTVTSDPDSSHIAVTPETGNEDDITTIDGDPDGRVIVLVPSNESFELTIKPQVQVAISSVNPMLNEFTVVGHGLVTGQLIGLSGAGLPADVTPGAYYALVTGANTFKVATSKANAISSTVVEVVNAGTGFLEVGNIKISHDLTLTGRQSAMLVKDGSTYTLLGSSAGLIGGGDSQNDLLTSLANLVTAGEAGHFIRVNATENGFDIADYGLDELGADLVSKADVEHGHDIADVVGLSEQLTALQNQINAQGGLDPDLAAIAALTTQPFGRNLLTLSNVKALQDLVGTKAPTPPGRPGRIDKIDWSDRIRLTTPRMADADSYRWKIFLADGVTQMREIVTTTNVVEYSNEAAEADGIARGYRVQVAGINDNGDGEDLMSGVLNNAAPAPPTNVVFADGPSSSAVTFTPSTDPQRAGYLIAFSTVPNFDPLTQGEMFIVTRSPAYTPQLPAGTYYGKVATLDVWSQRPDMLTFSAEDAFTITAGTGGAPSAGGGGGGYTGGGARHTRPSKWAALLQ